MPVGSQTGDMRDGSQLPEAATHTHTPSCSWTALVLAYFPPGGRWSYLLLPQLIRLSSTNSSHRTFKEIVLSRSNLTTRQKGGESSTRHKEPLLQPARFHKEVKCVD